MHAFPQALLLAVDAVDILFFVVLFVIGVVITLLINPLNSWVDKLLGRDKKGNG